VRALGNIMPKNIVILLDGTSNQISAKRTNVLRLYGTLKKSDEQLVYYDPGVGTFGADTAFFAYWRKAVEILGLLTGWGLDHNVKEAYRFLVENYERGDGGETRDRIYIFGFSRGAYCARVLAGFVHAFGLMERRNLNLLDYVYRAYKDISGDDERQEQRENDKSFDEIRLHERILAPDRPPIRLLGLFDTVATIIEHGYRGFRFRSHAFTKTNPSVESVRHAVAMHEKRTLYQAKLWPEDQPYRPNRFDANSATPQDAREVWFAGAHTDVGGGQPEAESQLAKIPLHWMIEQTKATGLLYNTRTVNEIVLGTNPEKAYVAPDPHAAMHARLNFLWSCIEFVPRSGRAVPGRFNLLGLTFPCFRGRPIPDDARIHRAVIERRDKLSVDKGSNDIPTLPPNHRIEA